MATQAPTKYAAPYMNMEQQGQPQNAPTQREYEYTRGDVVYRGDAAREREAAQGLYDSGDYDWPEAVKVAKTLLETQKQERKLRAQDTILALGDHKAKLQQKEIENNQIQNRQAALSELSSIRTEDVVNFSKNIENWRNKNQNAVAFDSVVQKQAEQKIKEQEFYANQMKNMLHASNVDGFVPEVVREDGSIDMSRAQEAGLKIKQRELQMVEDAREKLAARKAAEARLTKELTGKSPEGAMEVAAKSVADYGVEAEVKEGPITYKMTPSSIMQAKALKAQSMKEEEEARKKGMPTKTPAPEAPKFDPNDMEAAKKFMIEKQIEYADILGEDASSAQKLIELARKKGFNIR
jgi:hypothetical protein